MGQVSDLERPQQRFPVLLPSFCSAADFKLRLFPAHSLPPRPGLDFPLGAALSLEVLSGDLACGWPWALSPDLLCPFAQTPLECTLASEDAAPACLVMTLSTRLTWSLELPAFVVPSADPPPTVRNGSSSQDCSRPWKKAHFIRVSLSFDDCWKHSNRIYIYNYRI